MMSDNIMICVKLGLSCEYACSHLENVWRLRDNVSGCAEALLHRCVIGSFQGTGLAEVILQIEVGRLRRTADASHTVKEGLGSGAVRDLRVSCLVVEIVSLPFVERAAFEDEIGSSGWIGLHSLRRGAAEDVGVEYCRRKAGRALEPIVREDGSRLGAGNALLSAEEGRAAGAGLGVRLASSCSHFFGDLGRRSGDGSPQLDFWVGVVDDGFAVIGLRIVGLLRWASLADACLWGEILAVWAGDAGSAIEEGSVSGARQQVLVGWVLQQGLLVLLKGHLRRKKQSSQVVGVTHSQVSSRSSWIIICISSIHIGINFIITSSSTSTSIRIYISICIAVRTQISICIAVRTQISISVCVSVSVWTNVRISIWISSGICTRISIRISAKATIRIIICITRISIRICVQVAIQICIRIQTSICVGIAIITIGLICWIAWKWIDVSRGCIVADMLGLIVCLAVEARLGLHVVIGGATNALVVLVDKWGFNGTSVRILAIGWLVLGRQCADGLIADCPLV